MDALELMDETGAWMVLHVRELGSTRRRGGGAQGLPSASEGHTSLLQRSRVLPRSSNSAAVRGPTEYFCAVVRMKLSL